MNEGDQQPGDPAARANSCRRRWFACGELWLLIVIVLGIHFTRLTDTMLQGEETRRATVAMEMLRTGDWIVPDLQGDVFYFSNRPPLQQWLIAALGTLRGDVDAVAVRLPSALAVLATALLVWWYCGAFLSRLGAFAAAAAFASMGQVIELGGRGESDAVFTLFVSASLLLWHRGAACGWPALRTWTVAYFFVALATLTKGVQGPAYFAASLGAYLVVTKQWRFALSWTHLAGIAVFLVVLGSWLVPFYLHTNLDAVRYIYFGDVARYGNENSALAILEHMARYPVKLVFCLLPWSILIASLVGRDIRRATSALRGPMVFATCAVLSTFPSVWLIQGAESRFFMSMYPCFAVMVGIVAQLSIEAAPHSPLKGIWSNFAKVQSLAVLLTGAAIVVATYVDSPLAPIRQPRVFALLFLAVCMVLAVLLWRGRHARSPRQGIIGVTCIAVYTGLIVTGIVTNVDVRNASDKVADIERAKDAIPAGEMLYSLGPVDHGFAFYYRDAIAKTDWPDDGEPLPDDVEYFVFQTHAEGGDDAFDFAWAPVAFVDTSTSKSGGRSRLVIVARTLSGQSHGRLNADVVREHMLRMQAAAPGHEHMRQ
jgi:4-amino-4-deoxy-L-arabinose transferase-like glycosyltransferase